MICILGLDWPEGGLTVFLLHKHSHILKFPEVFRLLARVLMKAVVALLRQCRRVGSCKCNSQLRSPMQGRSRNRNRKMGDSMEQLGVAGSSSGKLCRGFGTTSASDNTGGAGVSTSTRPPETVVGSNSISLLTPAVKKQFFADGFVRVDDVLSQDVVSALTERYDRLFRGDFETGIFPDEWHWREGLSLPDVTREIVNGWKCDSLVASVVRSPHIGRLVADLMCWEHGTRVGQDSVLWKPAGAGGVTFHQAWTQLHVVEHIGSFSCFVCCCCAAAPSAFIGRARWCLLWYLPVGFCVHLRPVSAARSQQCNSLDCTR